MLPFRPRSKRVPFYRFLSSTRRLPVPPRVERIFFTKGCMRSTGIFAFVDPDADLEDSQTVRLEVAETVCIECHNEEHSDAFEYEKYKAKLMAPGHGKPVL